MTMLGNGLIISGPDVTNDLINHVAEWAGIGKSVRLQFANGTSGPWQGKLGAGFSNGSQVEISRI